MAKKVAGTKDDPTIRFAEVEIDDKVYKLAYSFAAIARAEKVTGVNMLLGMVGLDDIAADGFPGANYVLAHFSAALSVAHPELGYDDVAGLIRPDNIGDIFAACREAQRLSRKDYVPEKKSATPEPEVSQAN
jgi:hypothetical protein